MEIINSSYIDSYIEYVLRFEQEPNLICKTDHSFRVMKNITYIFYDLGFKEEYIELARFIGLYHDFGRYEQWRRYKSFNDQKTIDHANFSADLLFEKQLIRKVISNNIYDCIMYNSILYHNKYSLPSSLDLRITFNDRKTNRMSLEEYVKSSSITQLEKNKLESCYCQAIRDADKVDILNLLITGDLTMPECNEPVSNKIRDDFFKGMSIKKGNGSNSNDAMVLRLAFMNDINFIATLKLIQKTHIIDNIYDICPNKKILGPYFKFISNKIKNQIDNTNDKVYVLKKN